MPRAGYVYVRQHGDLVEIGGLSDMDYNPDTGQEMVEVEAENGFRTWLYREDVLLYEDDLINYRDYNHMYGNDTIGDYIDALFGVSR